MLNPLTNHFLTVCLLALLGIAVLTDLRERRIPNLIVMIGLVIGIFGHAWSAGFSGLTIGASGACVGLLCFLPFYNSGGMGAGDVKLMAMSGAFIGPAHVITAAAATLFVGGIFGIAWAFWQRASATEDQPVQGELGSGIPYAFAIAFGTCISLMAAPAITNIIK